MRCAAYYSPFTVRDSYQEEWMKRKPLYLLLASTGATLLAVCAIALVVTGTVEAQCGSQASSCKNCHEVQAKDPVNVDGTGWHQSHAFGDFCYICHGGNSQATDEAAAHQGMVAPMSDVKAACQQCHAEDLQARAEVYAKVLNVPVGMGDTSAAPAATSAPAEAAAAQPAAAEASIPAGSGQLVDYVQRYDEKVLNKFPVNWGNVILWVMLIAMLLGGGTLVLLRETLVRVTFQETKPVEGEYPADVVDMVPDVAKLKPEARKTLRRLLRRPDAGKVFDAVETLSSDNQEDQAE